MKEIRAIGRTKDGKLDLFNRKRMEEELSLFPNGEVEILIKRRHRRSNPQNRYYWGVVVEEIRLRLIQLGNKFDADTIHQFLKSKFAPVPIIDLDGTVIDNLPGSTAKMNKDEFGEYLDSIIQWSAEFLQISIPLPSASLQFFTDEEQ